MGAILFIVFSWSDSISPDNCVTGDLAESLDSEDAFPLWQDTADNKTAAAAKGKRNKIGFFILESFDNAKMISFGYG